MSILGSPGRGVSRCAARLAALLVWVLVAPLATPATALAQGSVAEVDRTIAETERRLTAIAERRRLLESQIRTHANDVSGNFTRRQQLRELASYEESYQAELADLARIRGELAERAGPQDPAAKQSRRTRAAAPPPPAGAAAQPSSRGAPPPRGDVAPDDVAGAAPAGRAPGTTADAAGTGAGAGNAHLAREDVQELMRRWALGEAGVPGVEPAPDHVPQGLGALVERAGPVAYDPRARTPLLVTALGATLAGAGLGAAMPLVVAWAAAAAAGGGGAVRTRDATYHVPRRAPRAMPWPSLAVAGAVGGGAAALALLLVGGWLVRQGSPWAGAVALVCGVATGACTAWAHRGGRFEPMTAAAGFTTALATLLSGVALSPYGPTSVAFAALAMGVLTAVQLAGAAALARRGSGPARSWGSAGVAGAWAFAGGVSGVALALVRAVSP